MKLWCNVWLLYLESSRIFQAHRFLFYFVLFSLRIQKKNIQIPFFHIFIRFQRIIVFEKNEGNENEIAEKRLLLCKVHCTLNGELWNWVIPS